jgi:hypothetical protein
VNDEHVAGAVQQHRPRERGVVDGSLRRPTWRRPLATSFVVAFAVVVFGANPPIGAVSNVNLPPFTSRVVAIDATQLGATWRPGCPVAPAQLRLLEMSFVGFNGRARTGSMVVNTQVARSVIRVFAALYAVRFPLRRMVPASRFGGSDSKSMAADNTSGFNCRDAVASGARQWSVHAFGEAIDVNPVENPYVFDGGAEPVAGRAFLSRHDVRPGMAVSGGALTSAFASVGWYWGGRWSSLPDYQHFSATGG